MMQNKGMKKVHIEENGRNIISIVILIFLVAVIDGAWLTFRHPYSIDEMTSIGVPVFFSGVDWTDLMTLRLKWHGFGATILATPFIKIFGIKNAYLILQIECLLFRVIACLLTFFISKKYFFLSEVQAAISAVLCNFGTLSPDEGRVLSAMTEVPITLIMIVILSLTIEGGLKQEKRRIATTSLSVTLIVYMALIHSRVLVVALSYVIIIVFSKVFFRRWVISQVSLAAFAFLAIIEAIILYGYIDEKLYSFAGEIANTYNSVGNMAANGLSHVFTILEGENLYNFGLVFLSLCGSATFYSFGFIWIAVAVNVTYIYRKIKQNENEFDPLLIASLFGLISYWGMDIAYAIKSTNMVAVGYFRILTYLRYAVPFAWIMVLSALAIIFKGKYDIKATCTFAIFASLFCMKFFLAKAVPLLEKSGLGMSDTLFNKFLYKGESVREYFIKILGFTVIILPIMLICMKKRKNYIMITVYTGISLVCMHSTYSLWEAQDQRHRNRVDSLNEVVRCLNQKDVNMDIYYYFEKNACYQYFLIDNIDIKMNYAYNLEEIDLSDGVLFSDAKIDLMDNAYTIKLDVWEYVYTLDTDIYEYIKSLGF